MCVMNEGEGALDGSVAWTDDSLSIKLWITRSIEVKEAKKREASCCGIPEMCKEHVLTTRVYTRTRTEAWSNARCLLKEY